MEGNVGWCLGPLTNKQWTLLLFCLRLCCRGLGGRGWAKGLSGHMDGWAHRGAGRNGFGLLMRPEEGSGPARPPLAEGGWAWGETSLQTQ